MSPTAGLVLAAGAGTRFGSEPKQLADLHGRPLLQWALDAQLAIPAGRLDPVVLVLGARAERIRGAIDPGRARIIVCEGWEQGQGASLAAGLDALPDADRVLVTLGDAPLVSAEVIELFLARARPARALHDGRPGHPVLLGAGELRALRVPGAHPRPVAPRERLTGIERVEVGHLCSGRDVDTPEDLEEVRDAARAVV